MHFRHRIAAAIALAMLLPCVAALPARAGAWPQPEGAAMVIARIAYSAATQGYDATGAATRDTDFRKTELELYGEYGLTPAVTLIAKPVLQKVETETARQTGLASIELGARARLWEAETGGNFAVQGSVILPGEDVDSANPLLNSGHVDYDARLLYGWPDFLLFWDTYTDVQLAYRRRGGAPADEVRLDATLGLKLSPSWTFELQSFSIVSIEAADPPYETYASQKMQIGLSYAFDEGRTVTLGALHTAAGTNTVRETGGFLSLRVDF